MCVCGGAEDVPGVHFHRLGVRFLPQLIETRIEHGGGVQGEDRMPQINQIKPGL